MRTIRAYIVFEKVTIYSVYLSGNIDKITAYHKQFSSGTQKSIYQEIF